MKISKELVDYLTNQTGVKQRELIEKDIYLHLLLKELEDSEYFRTNYVFKGGTCIIKCYLGYYRFSEDLDFSWINQQIFLNKTEKQIRKQLSEEITTLGKLLVQISEKLNLDFELNKQDQHYMEFGGSNKFVTFKLWYESIELRTKQFIKIQINYVEKFSYKFRKLKVMGLFIDINKREFKFLYPDAAQILSKPLAVLAYDIREIAAEKVRAILTRRGIKTRDFIDLYMIQKHKNINIYEIEGQIVDKTLAMLKYEKYHKNLLEKSKHRPTFRTYDEEKLLLEPLDPQFLQFINNFNKFIDTLTTRILQNM